MRFGPGWSVSPSRHRSSPRDRSGSGCAGGYGRTILVGDAAGATTRHRRGMSMAILSAKHVAEAIVSGKPGRTRRRGATGRERRVGVELGSPCLPPPRIAEHVVVRSTSTGALPEARRDRTLTSSPVSSRSGISRDCSIDLLDAELRDPARHHVRAETSPACLWRRAGVPRVAGAAWAISRRTSSMTSSRGPDPALGVLAPVRLRVPVAFDRRLCGDVLEAFAGALRRSLR